MARYCRHQVGQHEIDEVGQGRFLEFPPPRLLGEANLPRWCAWHQTRLRSVTEVALQLAIVSSAWQRCLPIVPRRCAWHPPAASSHNRLQCESLRHCAVETPQSHRNRCDRRCMASTSGVRRRHAGVTEVSQPSDDVTEVSQPSDGVTEVSQPSDGVTASVAVTPSMPVSTATATAVSQQPCASHPTRYVWMHACMYACMHACMHVCMYACMYACMLHACAHRIRRGSALHALAARAAHAPPCHGRCMCRCVYMYVYDTYIYTDMHRP